MALCSHKRFIFCFCEYSNDRKERKASCLYSMELVRTRKSTSLVSNVSKCLKFLTLTHLASLLAKNPFFSGLILPHDHHTKHCSNHRDAHKRCLQSNTNWTDKCNGCTSPYHPTLHTMGCVMVHNHSCIQSRIVSTHKWVCVDT